MKIKTKKQLNLPQLIEWGWGNPSLSRNKRFFSKDEKLGITKHCVHFNDFGYPEVDNRYCLEPADTFTVEVEEEITEDTRLDLIERFIGGTDCVCYTSQRATIKECLKRSPSDCTTTHFYIENDNRELILIWRDGKLVE